MRAPLLWIFQNESWQMLRTFFWRFFFFEGKEKRKRIYAYYPRACGRLRTRRTFNKVLYKPIQMKTPPVTEKPEEKIREGHGPSHRWRAIGWREGEEETDTDRQTEQMKFVLIFFKQVKNWTDLISTPSSNKIQIVYASSPGRTRPEGNLTIWNDLIRVTFDLYHKNIRT